MIVKSGKEPAIIWEAQGPKQWKVEKVDEEMGEPLGVFYPKPLKSQQMRQTYENEFPAGWLYQ